MEQQQGDGTGKERFLSVLCNDDGTLGWSGFHSVSDGDIMGAVLDRNGLRPSRYYVTNDGYLILSSEVGVLPVDESRIKLKDRLRPGKMLLVDTVKGELIDDDELKENMQPSSLTVNGWTTIWYSFMI